jgi:hypothetical protein
MLLCPRFETKTKLADGSTVIRPHVFSEAGYASGIVLGVERERREKERIMGKGRQGRTKGRR